MICTSIKDKNFEELREILCNPDPEMVELRLDSCALTAEQIYELFSQIDIPVIATCRTEEGCTEDESMEKLKAAIEAGANYVDLEIESKGIERKIKSLCRTYGVGLIRSFHDFDGTPEEKRLKAIKKELLRKGDYAKIVTMALSEEDCARVMDLYPQDRLIAFCMGENGKESRIEALRLGAPWTYAALKAEEATAPGQTDLRKMEILCSTGSFRRDFEAVIPCSKSYAQRAIIAATLAEGTSKIGNFSHCRDSDSAIEVSRALGAQISISEDTLTIRGTGGKINRPEKIHTGESGLLTRLMMPLCAAMGEGRTEITGEKTLIGRPLKGAGEALQSFGVSLEGPVTIPTRIRGTLKASSATIDGQNGSQIISGLLMALPLLGENSSLRVENPKSLPYLFITKDVISRFGIKTDEFIEVSGKSIVDDFSDCSAISYNIKGGQRYKAASFNLEGDWSGAAPFFVAGAIFGSASLKGLEDDSLQSDRAIIDIITDAGGCISRSEDGTFIVRKGPLEGFEADLNQCPDLFPTVAVLAAFCNGESHLEGALRLGGKESDRAKVILEFLTKMGIEVHLEDDTITIRGESLTSRIMNNHLLKGGHYSSHHDHRIVMALRIASCACETPLEIDDEECIAKSFPLFDALWNNRPEK